MWEAGHQGHVATREVAIGGCGESAASLRSRRPLAGFATPLGVCDDMSKWSVMNQEAWDGNGGVRSSLLSGTCLRLSRLFLQACV